MALERVHHTISREVMRRAGFKTGGCACLSMALACGANPYRYAEWGERARMLSDYLTKRTLNRIDGVYYDPERGCWHGTADQAMDLVGLKHVTYAFKQRPPYYLRTSLPTVAAVARGMKPGQRAIFRSTGHMGYAEAREDAVHLWDLQPKGRVDHIFILTSGTDDPRYTLNVEDM